MPDQKAEHSMRVTRRTYDELHGRKGPGDSFDDMIWQALVDAGWVED
jgi:hypothetical protein